MKMSSCHSLLPLLFLIIGFLQCFSAETSGHGKTAESTAAAGLATKRRLKVLVFSPAYCWSHVQYMSRIADTLQEAGHEAHFLQLIVNPLMHGKNATRKVQSFEEISLKISEQMDINQLDMFQDTFSGRWPLLNLFDNRLAGMWPLTTQVCRELAENTELLTRLAGEHFDVGIAEMYEPCPAAIFHRIGIPVKLGTFAVPLGQWAARPHGIPSFSSFTPNIWVPTKNAYLENSFFTRAQNFVNDFADWAWLDDEPIRQTDPLLKRAFGPEFPGLKELGRNVSLIFVNTSPFFSLARPISSKIIDIGGIVDKLEEEKQLLDERIKQILDNAHGGAVLFSFGSLADTRQMSPEMRSTFLRAFSRFPNVQFLWKLDKETIQNNTAQFAAYPNVHTFDWVRQTAVLNHPNLRTFITHCGQNSLTETIWARVPVIGIPLFGDQLYNAIVTVQRGLGVYLDIRELNGPNAESMLVEALEKVLHDPSYAQNARLIQRKKELTPFSPVERLVRWVEFAAEFPGGLDELNMPSDEQMHWIVYYSLDVIFVSLTLFLAMAWIAWKMGRAILSQLINRMPMIIDQLKQLSCTQKEKIK